MAIIFDQFNWNLNFCEPALLLNVMWPQPVHSLALAASHVVPSIP
ncbi:MAG: hypothetical protein P4L61_00675 [Candidatus Pacebacteria bacterium]|nr:hypothetical protein [Candidatus Paceibacterota bacterium]